MSIDSVLKVADPMNGRDTPEADLDDLRRIVGDTTTRSTKAPRTVIVQQVSRRPLFAVTLVIVLLALALVVVPVGVGVLSSHGTTPPATPTTSPGHASGRTGPWSLAGYITASGWQASSKTGPLPTTQQFTTQLACPSATTCYSSGTYEKNRFSNSQSVVSVTHDAGEEWGVSLAPTDDTYFYGFSCQSGDVCAVLGAVPGASPVLYSTTDGGLTWNRHPLPASKADPLEMSCATANDCVVIGSTPVANNAPGTVAWTTSDGGSTWTAAQLPTNFAPSFSSSPADVSCFADGSCIADGTTSAKPGGASTAEMISSIDAGLTWSTATTPSVSSMAGVMSCSSDEHCVAVQMQNDVHGIPAANGVLATSDAGATWSLLAAPSLDSANVNRPIGIDSLACATSTTCWASAHVIESLCEGSCGYVADRAVMLVSLDGGKTWTSDPLPAPPSPSLQYVQVFPVTCVNASDCLTVGTLALTQAASRAGMTLVQQDVVLSNGDPSGPNSTN
jgi:photosystem II stability/assembly factor-like uncharacterized protein